MARWRRASKAGRGGCLLGGRESKGDVGKEEDDGRGILSRIQCSEFPTMTTYTEKKMKKK
jgi:hypothetical protein